MHKYVIMVNDGKGAASRGFNSGTFYEIEGTSTDLENFLIEHFNEVTGDNFEDVDMLDPFDADLLSETRDFLIKNYSTSLKKNDCEDIIERAGHDLGYDRLFILERLLSLIGYEPSDDLQSTVLNMSDNGDISGGYPWVEGIIRDGQIIREPNTESMFEYGDDADIDFKRWNINPPEGVFDED